jgi:hypothetical protein
MKTSVDVIGEALSLTFMISEVSCAYDLSSGLVLEDNIISYNYSKVI